MDQTMSSITTCPFCGQSVDLTAFFCQTCGKKLREKPVGTGVSAQLFLYALSVLVPPFGIGLTLRYYKSPDAKAKQIGLISLVLTIISLVVLTVTSIFYVQNLFAQINQSMSGLNYGF
jgi:hypothetical protein